MGGRLGVLDAPRTGLMHAHMGVTCLVCTSPGIMGSPYNSSTMSALGNVNSGAGKTLCRAWTINTNNGWCGLKGDNQIKPEINSGFESGIINADSQHCNSGTQGGRGKLTGRVAWGAAVCSHSHVWESSYTSYRSSNYSFSIPTAASHHPTSVSKI